MGLGYTYGGQLGVGGSITPAEGQWHVVDKGSDSAYHPCAGSHYDWCQGGLAGRDVPYGTTRNEAGSLHGPRLPLCGGDGRRLMEQVEEMHSRKLALKSVKSRPRTENVTEDEKSMRFFYDLFPQVPQHIAEKVVGFHNFDASRIPWNRKMRKKVEEATKTGPPLVLCGKGSDAGCRTGRFTRLGHPMRGHRAWRRSTQPGIWKTWQGEGESL